MKLGALTIFYFLSAPLSAGAPRAGDPADIAPFGVVVVWRGEDPRDLAARAAERKEGAFIPAEGPVKAGGRYLGLEWESPRIVSELVVVFRAGSAPRDSRTLRVDYWHKSWDGRATPASGWAQIDDPLTGSWKRAGGEWTSEGDRFAYRFSPKLSAEIEKAPDVAFRKTYKVRIAFGEEAPPVESIAALSPGKWTECSLEVAGIEKGDGSVEWPAPVEIHNGRLLDPLGPLSLGAGKKAALRLLRLDLGALGGDRNPRDERTVVTLGTPKGRVSFSPDDALEAVLTIPDFGIEIRAPGAPPAPSAGKRVLEAIRDEPEQTWSRARREVISPIKTFQRGEECYTPLSWDSHRHKFMVFHDGSVAMDVGSGKLWETSAAKLGWSADRVRYRFLSGDDLWKHEGEHETRQELEDGYLPVVTTTWDHDGIRYQETAFSTLLGERPGFESVKGDEPAVLVLRFRITNLLPEKRSARLVVTPDRKEDMSMVVMAGKGTIRVDLPGLHTEVRDVLIPFAAPDEETRRRLLLIDVDRERAAVLAYWRGLLDAEGSRIRVPDATIADFVRANRAHIAISVQRDLKTGFDMVPAATFNYSVCMNEACYQILAMDVQGLHRRAERYLEPFLQLQGTQGLDGGFRSKDGVFHGLPVEGHNYQGFRYNLDHGFVLWTLGEHYLLSRDRAWMEKNAGRLVAGCDFITRERRAALQAAGGDRTGIRGLVPPGHLEDVAEWHRWFAVNSYFHLGMKRAGQALRAFEAPRAEEILAEAEAYRRDIAQAAAWARERSPVVRVRDGSAIPHTPARADLRGREVGWIREQLYGSIHLVLGEVLDPRSREAGWIADDFEDNLFLSPEYGRKADLPGYWFSQGGQAVQSNLVPCVRLHLLRGDHPAAVRTLLNNLATNCFQDLRQSTEHPVEHFGHGRGPFYKSSDEGSWVVSLRNALVFEPDPDTLWLLAAAPRKWFGPGEVISVQEAASWFGPVSLLVQGGSGEVQATVKLPSRNPPRRAVLFLRDAQGRPAREAFAIDPKRPLPIADPAEGGIDLSGLAGEIRLQVGY